MSENNNRTFKDYIPLIMMITVVIIGLIILVFTASVPLSFGITAACMAMISIKYAKKNKSLAIVLTFIPTPFLPLARIYTGDYQLYSLPIWVVPLLGNFYDFLALTYFEKYKLEPKDGWSASLFDGIPILEKL